MEKKLETGNWKLAVLWASFYFLISIFTAAPHGAAQQPTTTLPTAEMNAHYVSGRTWADFKPSKGSGLTLNIAAGTAQCAPAAYAGGTLTMAASQTNYVYLDPDADCAPASNTSGFGSTVVRIAVVVTGASTITTVTDSRGFFFSAGVAGSTVAFRNINNIRIADQFSGADLGAKINAADADLGSNAGEIWVTGSGTLTTQVSLSSNHTLQFKGNITVNTPTQILIPPTSQNAHIECDGSVLLNNTQTSYDGGYQNFSSIQIGSYAAGYGATATTSLSTDTAAGTSNIAVSNSAGFVAGQDILLKENYAGYRYAEWNTVASAPDGTHITLRFPTEHAYRSAGPTGVYGFTAGALAKNWSVKGCRFTSTTTAPSATGSANAIFVATATDGTITGNDIENVGSRGILIGASGYPAGRIIVANNRIRRGGLVPAAGGSPSLEVYVQSSHVSFDSNQIYGSNGHGVAVHGFLHTISSNQVYGTTNSGSAGFASDTGESIVFSNNLAANTGGVGYVSFGSGTEGTTETSRVSYIGNIAQDTAGDCFQLGTAGSSAYVESTVVNNFAYRCRGSNAFIFYGAAGGTIVHNIEGNTSEGNATGFALGTAALGVRMVGNFSKNDITAFSLNSPKNGVFVGNGNENSTTGLALGTGDYMTIVGNRIADAITGTPGANSTVLGVIGMTHQLATASQTLDLNINNLTGVVDLDMIGISFGSLGTPADGRTVFCYDCAKTNPCTGSGSGAIASRAGGAWDCGGGGGGSNHAILSATHSDSTAASVVRGDIITGQGATPKWTRLAKGAASECLKMDGSAVDVLWGTCGSGSAHNLLSSTHSDTTASSALLGGMVYADATPKWVQLAGNTAASTKFLTQTGNGSISAVPVWSTIGDGDVPNTITIDLATAATSTAITDDTTTAATMYPTWVTAATGNLAQKVSSSKLTFNPSAGILTATGGFAGGAATDPGVLTLGATTSTTPSHLDIYGGDAATNAEAPYFKFIPSPVSSGSPTYLYPSSTAGKLAIDTAAPSANPTAAKLILIGGDKYGSTPGAKLVTTDLGADPTNNNCVKWLTNGILGDAGAACGSGGGGATTALDNLAAVAINLSLLPGTDDSIHLGSASKQWKDIFFSGTMTRGGTGDFTLTATATNGNIKLTPNGSGDILPGITGADFGSATLPLHDIFFSGTSGTPGTNNFKITGVSTSGTRVITAADGASVTVVATTCTSTDKVSAITTAGAVTCTADETGGGSAHNFLSATHSDTTASSALLGGMVYADATPKWVQLAGNTTTTIKTLMQTGNGSISAVPAWTALSLASAQFVNQGTTTTLLHGNAGGNPSWAGVSLTADATANQGTTTTLLHGNAAGQPTFGAIVSADLNITTTTCTNQFVSAISSAAAGTCSTVTLAGAQFANQGTTTTLLHGNAGGNPSWAGVSLTADATANQGTTITVLHGNSAGQPSFAAVTSADTTGTFAPTAHNVLSTSHGDSAAASAVLGDIIHGNATPAWARLAGNITTQKKALTQVGNASISAVPAWEQIAYSDLSGTPSTFAPTAHNLLSTSHGDTTAASVVRGDLMVGIGATPKWERLAKGAASECLKMDGSAVDILWGACGGGSGASLALDNLAAVAINLSLLPGTDDSIHLGSASKQWKDIFFSGTMTRGGTGDLTLTATATNGNIKLIPNGTGDFTFGAGAAFTMTYDAGATDPVIDYSSGNIKYSGATTYTFEGGATDPVWTPGNSIMDLSTGTLKQGGVLVGLTNAIGTTGTAPNWSTATLNIPLAITASVTAGLISKTEFDTFNGKAQTGSPAACTNQFATDFDTTSSAAPTSTCTTATLASAQFANQGTTTTVLHGNGAGNPAFGEVVTGDIAADTITDDDVAAELDTVTKDVVILSPVTGFTNFSQVYFPTAVTITRVACSVAAATSVTIQLDERAEATPNTAGTDVLTGTLACDVDSQTTTSFANATIAARVPLNLQITAVSGTPGAVRIHIEATID